MVKVKVCSNYPIKVNFVSFNHPMVKVKAPAENKAELKAQFQPPYGES